MGGIPDLGILAIDPIYAEENQMPLASAQSRFQFSPEMRVLIEKIMGGGGHARCYVRGYSIHRVEAATGKVLWKSKLVSLHPSIYHVGPKISFRKDGDELVLCCRTKTGVIERFDLDAENGKVLGQSVEKMAWKDVLAISSNGQRKSWTDSQGNQIVQDSGFYNSHTGESKTGLIRKIDKNGVVIWRLVFDYSE